LKASDYFTAVQEGRARIKRALDLLQDVAGPSYPMLFLKIGPKEWTPVGEENLYSLLMGKNETAAVVLCDSEGNSKAMSTWVSRPKAAEFASVLESKGVLRFAGEVKLPS